MLVKEVMTPNVITVTTTDSLSKAITLMIQDHLSGLPVLDGIGELVGILSEGDLLRRVELGSGSTDESWLSRLLSSRGSAETFRLTHGRQVGDVMSEGPITIEADASLGDAARLMQKHRIKRLPVMRDGELVGLLSRADFVKALRVFVAPTYEEAAISDEEIKRRIMVDLRRQDWSADCRTEVDVRDGKVLLKGFVPSRDHQASVRIIAESIPGVVSVDDQQAIAETICVPGY